MKTIYRMLFLITIAIFNLACDNENNVAEQQNLTIEISGNGTTLPADGGSKTITVTNSHSISATASDSWLVVDVDNETVTISATKNNSLESRNAIVNITANGLNPCLVNIMQMGAVLYVKDAPSTIVVNDESHIKEYDLVSSVSAQAYSVVDWAQASIVDDKLRIDFSTNNDGRIRDGFIYYSNGLKTDSLRIRQGEFKDIQGFYFLAGINLATGQEEYILAAVGSTDDYPAALTVLLQGEPDEDPQFYTTPVSFDQETLTLHLNNMGYLGSIETDGATHHLACVLGNYSLGSSLETGVSANFPFVCDKESQKNLALLSDNGSWSVGQVNMLSIMQFHSIPMSEDNVVENGVLLNYALPYLFEYQLNSAGTHGVSTYTGLKRIAMQNPSLINLKNNE